MSKKANPSGAKRQIAPPNRAGPPAIRGETVGKHISVELNRPGLKELGGSEVDSFNFWILKAALNVRREFSWTSDSDKAQQVSAIMQALRGFRPVDEIEGMMASQAVALHLGAMECFRTAAITDQSFEVA